VGRGLESVFLAQAVVLSLGIEAGPRIFRPSARLGLFWMNMVRNLCESVPMIELRRPELSVMWLEMLR
jgi:hypothetical protein